jgi:Na+/melibiose symporter-like transporter
MLRAIISDVADQERLKTGKDHSGLLFSIFNVTINAAFALSVGIALPLVGMFGFNPSGQNTPAALSSLQWIIAVGPAIGHTLSAILMITFPLDEERHREILQELALQVDPMPSGDRPAAAAGGG